MVKEILTRAGFVEGKTFKETRFLKAPKSTYCIYLDSFTGRGSDGLNQIKEHLYTIELYCDKPDATSEAHIEEAFNELGIEYEKSERYWLESEQLYQIVYTFNFIEK